MRTDLAPIPAGVTLRDAASLEPDAVLDALAASASGLATPEAEALRVVVGPNEVPEPRRGLTSVIAGQLRNPLLLLLFGTAVLSGAVGERTDAVIVLAILVASVTLGVVNDYRATTAAASLDATGRRSATVRRDGRWQGVDTRVLVPGDVVELIAGAIVPADLRLLTVDGLAIDESSLTGEALAVEKSVGATARGRPLAEWTSVALSSTVVRAGSGTGVVVATGSRAEAGRITRDLRGRGPRTAFEKGLREFSGLLARIAVAVSAAVFVINLLLGRGVLDALLFAAAIAVGITPQLLPAVVGSSLASGARALSRKKVLVKRLVAIEDLGDVNVLVTDKTGTLTEGQFRLSRSVGPAGAGSDDVARLAVLATTLEHGDDGAVTGDALDAALWHAVPDAASLFSSRPRLAVLPFDHARRRVAVLVRDGVGARIVVKGAPEQLIELCADVTDDQRTALQELLETGGRVLAVGSRLAEPASALRPADEGGLRLVGYLVFDDPAKPGVSAALDRLGQLGIRVVIASGDSVPAARRLAARVGLHGGVLSGAEIDALDDPALARELAATSVLGRVTPEQKARVVRLLQTRHTAVGFLGDGVNDALALHQADVGISVDTAADVARDAADVVLLDKSLDVVADGIGEGRRIFANTIKYVLMGTSSNFGNILSAAAASALLDFLPMLPSQLLLNNLLYDGGQLAIPTDQVDPDQLRRPAQWDISVIRRFMLVFGPLSSLFDFVTFGILLGPFHAGPPLFRSGWFVESLATQTLVVFAIRTRRVPFWRSRPSRPLLLSTVAVVAAAALLPVSPIAGRLHFVPLGGWLYLAVGVLVIAYLALVDATKARVFRAAAAADRSV